jgi:antitoxin (DNA-binding transcriptional repressor) of toxin-antitoxin stability system
MANGSKSARVTIRDLRTRFPVVRDVIEREGEVVVTEHGRDAYVLRAVDAIALNRAAARPPERDYYARVRGIMPKPLTAAQRARFDADRDER